MHDRSVSAVLYGVYLFTPQHRMGTEVTRRARNTAYVPMEVYDSRFDGRWLDTL